jgi:hypothetical protein
MRNHFYGLEEVIGKALFLLRTFVLWRRSRATAGMPSPTEGYGAPFLLVVAGRERLSSICANRSARAIAKGCP